MVGDLFPTQAIAACGSLSIGHGHGAAAGASGGLYGLGFLGAAIYFISHAATFGMGVLGFLKAIVWPAFLVYKLLEHVGL